MSTLRKYELARWPAPDRAAWELATSTKIDYLDQNDFAERAPETKRQMFQVYSRWLDFLDAHDPAALAMEPEARFTQARLEGFIARLQHGARGRTVSAQTMASNLHHFDNAVRAVAPDYDRTWLRQAQKGFSRKIQQPNKRERMVPAGELYALGFKLMDAAPAIADPRAAARAFRDGLLIAVAVASTLRRKNLAALALDRNLYRVGAHYQIGIAAQDSKSRKPIDRALPDELTPYLDDYLAHYRPRFPGSQRCVELWLSSKDCALGPEAVWAAVGRRTRVEFGHGVNLHLIRDIAATSAPELGSALLGHRKAAVTDQHYRRSDSLGASRKLAGVIAERRAQAATRQGIAQGRDKRKAPAAHAPARRLRAGVIH